MWGKPCFEYVCDIVAGMDVFEKKYLLTDSAKIAFLSRKYAFDVIDDLSAVAGPKMIISGKALFLSKETLSDAVGKYKNGTMLSIGQQSASYLDPETLMFKQHADVNVVPAFVVTDGSDDVSYYPLPENESLVISTTNDFELGLVLMKKKLGRTLLTESILNRIEEKKEVFESCDDANTICLVGHSQLDFWNCTKLGGKKVRNCGIAGISSVEYNQYILDKNLLNCQSDSYVVMHGTNDIVYPYSDEFIIKSISRTFDYIYARNPKAKIYFLTIANTNGRLDRSNKRIDLLNEKLAEAFADRVKVVSLKPLSDRFGDLCQEYTVDGLHFSEKGYAALTEIVEKAIEG